MSPSYSFNEILALIDNCNSKEELNIICDVVYGMDKKKYSLFELEQIDRAANDAKRLIEEPIKGYIGGLVECSICEFQWASLYHISCDKLECPNCHFVTDFYLIKSINND